MQLTAKQLTDEACKATENKEYRLAINLCNQALSLDGKYRRASYLKRRVYSLIYKQTIEPRR